MLTSHCQETKQPHEKFKVDWFGGGGYIYRYTPRRYGPACYTTLHTWRPSGVFFVIAARLWNSLPDDITTANLSDDFSTKTKTFLFRRCRDNIYTWLLDNLLFVLSFYFLIFIIYFLVCFNPMHRNVVLQCFIPR